MTLSVGPVNTWPIKSGDLITYSFQIAPIFLSGPELYFLVLGTTGRPYPLVRVSIGSGYPFLLKETSSVKPSATKRRTLKPELHLKPPAPIIR